MEDFTMDEGEEIWRLPAHPQDLIDDALKYLLDRELISMEWSEEIEEMVFFMTDEQRKIKIPDDL